MPSSAELHNENTHALLSAFFNAIPDVLVEKLKALREKGLADYSPKVDYGTLYVQLITTLRSAYTQAKEADKLSIANLIYHLYHNDNEILTRTYKQVMHEHVHTSSPTHPELEEVYRHHVSQKSTEKYAAMSPLTAGGNMERFKSTLSSEFDPMSRGLPTIRRYRYSPNNLTEYRFPTQAQRVNGETKIDPLFEGFLSATPSHVYFNFLRRDERKFSGFKRLTEYMVKESKKENEMTQALEALAQSNTNLTVITLPADDALMDKKAYLKTEPTLNKEATMYQLTDVVMGNNKDGFEYKDFYISDAVREQLFPLGARDVQALLEESFKAVGIESVPQISEAQRQAVWFDFVNYQLPHKVISTLQPAGYNFSCKDAIDRGGVASAWYNLRQSFKTDSPMSREEFEQALHAAPLSTKGRGMNEHVNRLWNMVNEYVNKNPKELQDHNKSWLILWRDMHCPKKRAADVLEARLVSARDRLASCPEMWALIEPLLAAIEAEKGTVNDKWMGTLLEVVGRTMSLIEHKINNKLGAPETQNERQVYASLIKKVQSNAELGLLAKFMLWFQDKLTPTKDARKLVVETFKGNLKFFSEEVETPTQTVTIQTKKQ